MSCSLHLIAARICCLAVVLIPISFAITMAFLAPGSATSALTLGGTSSAAAVGAAGLDKLDSRFAAILNQCRVPAATMKLLGDVAEDAHGVHVLVAQQLHGGRRHPALIQDRREPRVQLVQT